MKNNHGAFIWYELMTTDIEGAKAFYEPVVGWKIGDKSDMPGMDYRMISAPDATIGGALQLDRAMTDQGAKPGWLGYVGVDDVDASVAAIKAAGGEIHMGPTDIPAGRLAMASDPQGAAFYVMRGAVDAVSNAFAPETDGHCEWNELRSTDLEGANSFYMDLFGWTNPERMAMGPMGDYCFLHVGAVQIGASMGHEGPSYWQPYFHVPSINAAIDAVKAHGGTIDQGPHEVPGGGNIIVGHDPQGPQFALSGPL